MWNDGQEFPVPDQFDLTCSISVSAPASTDLDFSSMRFRRLSSSLSSCRSTELDISNSFPAALVLTSPWSVSCTSFLRLRRRDNTDVRSGCVSLNAGGGSGST